MLREMTFTQYREWQAFADLEPFDETRQDIRIAHVVLTLLNLWRGKNKPAKTFDDILLPFGDAPKKSQKKTQTWQEQKRLGQMFFQMFNRSAAKQEAQKAKRERVRPRRMTPMEKHRARLADLKREL